MTLCERHRIGFMLDIILLASQVHSLPSLTHSGTHEADYKNCINGFLSLLAWAWLHSQRCTDIKIRGQKESEVRGQGISSPNPFLLCSQSLLASFYKDTAPVSCLSQYSDLLCVPALVPSPCLSYPGYCIIPCSFPLTLLPKL